MSGSRTKSAGVGRCVRPIRASRSGSSAATSANADTSEFRRDHSGPRLEDGERPVDEFAQRALACFGSKQSKSETPEPEYRQSLTPAPATLHSVR